MDELKSFEIIAQIKVLQDEMIKDLDEFQVKRKKVAAKRARSSSLKLAELYKTFRKQSVADCKTY